MKKLLSITGLVVGLMMLHNCIALPEVLAAQLPATVKIGIDPPTDSPTGYNVAQDGGAATFVSLPATGTCNDFFTNVASPCVEFSFTFTTAGAHNVSVASVSAGGASAPVTLAFNLSVPGVPSHGHIVK